MSKCRSCFCVTLTLISFLMFLPWCAGQNGNVPDNRMQPVAAGPRTIYPDAPSTVTKPAALDNSTGAVSTRAAAPAARGGLNRAIDRKYVVAMGAMLAASIVDVEKTNTCLEQRTCSFVPAPMRSRAALYGVGIPVDAGIAYVSYRLKERGQRWWLVPSLGIAAVNAYVAYHSAHEPSYH